MSFIVVHKINLPYKSKIKELIYVPTNIILRTYEGSTANKVITVRLASLVLRPSLPHSVLFPLDVVTPKTHRWQQYTNATSPYQIRTFSVTYYEITNYCFISSNKNCEICKSGILEFQK